MSAVPHDALVLPAIPLAGLRELWVHTGTACNLSCPFCHEGSAPGDQRLQAITLTELAPRLQRAAQAGVERFVFTGGEPLTAREIVPLLGAALALRPTLVLTNGTAPLIRRSHQLASLAALAHPLSFRVSLDHPDEARHDAARGPRNFRKALQGIALLRAAGFAVSVACQRDALGERETARRFAKLFVRHGLPADIALLQLPELGRPGAGAAAATLQPADFTVPAQLPASAPANRGTCCSRGRMLLRRDGALRVSACPLTNDDVRFDLADELAGAMATPVAPRHARCATCLIDGVHYWE